MEEIRVPIGDGNVSSPPPAAQPARQDPDPAARLRELAQELTRTRSRRLMLEYLRLRRAIG